MAEPILSYELKSLINKIKSDYVVEFPIQVITPNYLLLAIIEDKFCEGYSVITKLMMESTVEEFKQYVIDRIMVDTAGSIQITSPKFSDIYDTFAEEIADSGAELVTSALMLDKIISNDGELIKKLAEWGVLLDQVKETIIAYGLASNVAPKEVKPNKWTKKKSKTEKVKEEGEKTDEERDVTARVIPNENNIVETNCINMVRLASAGIYSDIIGFDDIIERIFDTFGKYERNTVAIVGPHGVGKTAVVEKLADVLYRQDCPKMFRDKYVMKFGDTISAIVIKEMSKQGKYIAFIDNLENMFMNKEKEQNNMMFMLELFNTQNLFTIFTMHDKDYAKYITSNPQLSRFVQKFDLTAPDDKQLNEILTLKSKVFEKYNNVQFNNDCINESIRLAKRFIGTEECPAAALNLLDSAGAYVKMREPEDKKIVKLKEELLKIAVEKNSIQNSSSAEEFDRKDQLIRREIEINKEITAIENKKSRQKKLPVTVGDMRKSVSNMLNIPLTEMDDDEKTRLKRLSDNLSAVVIGQDEAIDDITRAVKRQRVGLSNPNKPCVMLFVGTTGTGKSFLAKRLAYEMFGDEKNMVRLDMSEYSDKTSAAKLYGTSPGYVGYDDGGVLTEAIKKNNRCVLLLDEMEKANEEVFNVFLQVFDEGRLSDNKGTVVDFKNVIIIMTSNVGAKDISEKVNKIGFGKHDEDQHDKEIIKNAIKKTFKPEFINRIDNICYFNKLTDDNLRTIIVNEIKKVGKKMEDIGYGLDEDIYQGKLVDSIFDKVKEESEYGARPILREIQFQLEDKLTDYIIDNEVKPGFVFKYNDIYKEEKEENE